jgi:hypothetical protein
MADVQTTAVANATPNWHVRVDARITPPKPIFLSPFRIGLAFFIDMPGSGRRPPPVPGLL